MRVDTRAAAAQTATAHAGREERSAGCGERRGGLRLVVADTSVSNKHPAVFWRRDGKGWFEEAYRGYRTRHLLSYVLVLAPEIKHCRFRRGRGGRFETNRM